MEFKLDENSMREMVSKTIFDGMTQEHKDKMIENAIQGLLIVEKKNSYGGTQRINLLETFLKDGVERAARKIIEENLNTDLKFQENVENLWKDVVKKLFETELREKMISSISGNIINNFNPRGY